jgi:hypothetical protein
MREKKSFSFFSTASGWMNEMVDGDGVEGTQKLFSIARYC